ncbi:hypothetical protein GSI_13410 [Ganoderma sinense ZZ0214-1]|uniref:Uncharacterized protein n=1 Tax=Ganoderma sinense ZZ0214-1 TaxID=1077348 RepID=A0A2G8RSR1_9APHY|nr:hypothetical protein GSI_13410 [Ganoderma sinense ZZ0214-1]
MSDHDQLELSSSKTDETSACETAPPRSVAAPYFWNAAVCFHLPPDEPAFLSRHSHIHLITTVLSSFSIDPQLATTAHPNACYRRFVSDGEHFVQSMPDYLVEQNAIAKCTIAIIGKFSVNLVQGTRHITGRDPSPSAQNGRGVSRQDSPEHGAQASRTHGPSIAIRPVPRLPAAPNNHPISTGLPVPGQAFRPSHAFTTLVRNMPSIIPASRNSAAYGVYEAAKGVRSVVPRLRIRRVALRAAALAYLASQLEHLNSNLHPFPASESASARRALLLSATWPWRHGRFRPVQASQAPSRRPPRVGGIYQPPSLNVTSDSRTQGLRRGSQMAIA